MASVGLIGQKAGFSSPLPDQLKAILNSTATALRNVAESVAVDTRRLAEAKECEKDNLGRKENFEKQIKEKGTVHDGRIQTVAGSGAMAELGVGLEREKQEELYDKL